jgi:hypothetical protein
MRTPPSSASGPPSPLTLQALQLRHSHRYAAHPVENTLRFFGDFLGSPGAESHGGLDFQSAEGIYRAGAQGVPLPQVPQLPQSLVELTRLRSLDQAARRHLRVWAETHAATFDEAAFHARWEAQGRLGGAEHHVFHDEASGRWFKRLYKGVNESTLGDYFGRMRLHAILFPETAYRLEGFAIQPKSKALTPIVSQPHVEVDTDQPLVSKAEVSTLMETMGFASVQLAYEGAMDDGYFAYYHPATGVLAHDLHDENVVRMRQTGELAVIDPYISLARRGTWAALKLAEVGTVCPADDPLPPAEAQPA